MAKKFNDRAITKDGDSLLRKYGIKSIFLDQKLYIHLVFCKEYIPPLLNYGPEFVADHLGRGDMMVSEGVLINNVQVHNKIFYCDDVRFKDVDGPTGNPVDWYIIGYYGANALGCPLFVFDLPNYQRVSLNGGDIVIGFKGKGMITLDIYDFEKVIEQPKIPN